MEPTTEQPSIQQTFGAHHRKLERLYEEVLAAMRAGDWRTSREAWAVVEQQLTDHMALEERALLPRLAERHPVEAARLHTEHAELRRDLAELTAGIDLKRVSEAVATNFFDRLKAHAASEDALLYRWADRRLLERLTLVERLRKIGRV